MKNSEPCFELLVWFSGLICITIMDWRKWSLMWNSNSAALPPYNFTINFPVKLQLGFIRWLMVKLILTAKFCFVLYSEWSCWNQSKSVKTWMLKKYLESRTCSFCILNVQSIYSCCMTFSFAVPRSISAIISRNPLWGHS